MEDKSFAGFLKKYNRNSIEFFSIEWFFICVILIGIPGLMFMIFFDAYRNDIGNIIFSAFAIASALVFFERAWIKSAKITFFFIVHALIVSPLFVLYLYNGLLYWTTWLDDIDILHGILYLVATPFVTFGLGFLSTLILASLASAIFQSGDDYQTNKQSKQRGKKQKTDSANRYNKTQKEPKVQTGKKTFYYTAPVIQPEEKKMSKYEEVLGYNPYSLAQEELKRRLLKEQKKWISRTNAPNLDKRQEAERMLELLAKIEKELIL